MKRSSFDAVCFGEMLWDLLPSGALPGGAPMNVAYHLKKLGLHAALISKLGRDDRGEELVQLLGKNQLPLDFIQQDARQPTGTVQASVQADNEVRYEIIKPVAWDFIDMQRNYYELVRQSSFFIYGSLAARSDVSRITLFSLLDAAPKKILDINLRPPHFTKELIEQLLGSADILKLNEHELPLIASWYTTIKEEEEQIKLLQDRFSISVIIVTKGKAGAVVGWEGRITRHTGYSVTVADTVGSGDAFLAAFLSGYRKGEPMEKILAFSNALGAFIASKSGACPDYKLEEVYAFMEQSSPKISYEL